MELLSATDGDWLSVTYSIDEALRHIGAIND